MFRMNNFAAGVDAHCRTYLSSKGKTQAEIDAAIATHGATIQNEATTAWNTAASTRAAVLVQRNWHDTRMAIEAWIDANIP